MPSYYNFEPLLLEISEIYIELSNNGSGFREYTDKDLFSMDDINYHIYTNKNGNLSWRAFEVIHPLLYVHLVHTLTASENWTKICNRFLDFQINKNIECFSIPSLSLTKESDKAEQISNWWKNIEQKSIELALVYDYLYDTDIADCYSSIYTHSIAWAVETKEIAKCNKNNNNLLGNKIDKIIQMMQQGQTNGIPQGSNLMDFIAEIVLGSIDQQISLRISDANINNYKILRFRDDYRIFTNNPIEGATILQIISEVLLSMGMRLNSSKTKRSDDVITTAIKPDKLDWLLSYCPSEINPQQSLLLIRELSKKHPNSGSLKKELQKFYTKLDEYEIHPNSVLTLVSILTDICYRNPTTYTIYFAISSKLLKITSDEHEKNYIIDSIYNKFKKLPNTGFMQIWFKRMIKDSREDIVLDEKLCSYIDSLDSIWNSKWINNSKLSRCLENTPIVNIDLFKSLDEVIQEGEFSLFNYD